jgi:hypothetical protein
MKQVLFVCASAMLLFSCSKKEASVQGTNPSNPPAPTYSISDYTKLTPGNYWVYQEVTIDTLNNITALPGLDSCYIKGDTVINGNSYAIMVNMPPTAPNSETYLRDSASFLVNNHGGLLFTCADFNTIFYKDSVPNQFTLTYSVSSTPSTVLTPMGTYSCYDDMGTFTYLAHALWFPVRYMHNYYAANLGLVDATSFYTNSPNTIQYWLVRARVN